MTDLLDEGAPDVDEVFVAMLAPVLRTTIDRDPDDELPFCLVQRIDGPDNPNCGTDDPVVQLDILAHGIEAAKDAADRVHRRVMYVARMSPDIEIASGPVNVDFIDTLMKPKRMPYPDDQIVRFVARYAAGLSYVTVT